MEREATMDPGITMRIRYWGTRGSVPTPGPSTAHFGGNTSCVEVDLGEARIILDSGTGIRLLGKAMLAQGPKKPTTLLLTHFHWDHIQGFPYFFPAYSPGFRIRVVGPRQGVADIATLLRGQLAPVHFPMPPESLSSDLSFHSLEEQEWGEGGAVITHLPARHPSSTVGYKVDYKGRSVAYLPDNELVGGSYDTVPDWRRRLEEFLEGVDLLIHDAMLLDSEYRDRVGWGHSTDSQALDLARSADVKALHLFHHAPWRTDDNLQERLKQLERGAVEAGIRLAAAQEGQETTL